MGPQKTGQKNSNRGQLELLIIDPLLTETETLENCRLARGYNPTVLWVKPCYVQAAAAFLRSADIQIGTIIGCLDGSNHTQIKVAEAKRALTEGATHLGMYPNVGYAREKNKNALLADLKAVSGIAHMNGASFEVTLHPEYLEKAELVEAAIIARQADVDVVSLPVESVDSGEHFRLAAHIKNRMGDAVMIKGLLHLASMPNLSDLKITGVDRLGVCTTFSASL